MYFRCYNRPKHLSKEQLKEIHNFCSERLFSTQLQNNLSITLKFEKGFHKRTKFWAECGVEHLEETYLPRNFEIIVDPAQAVNCIIKCIAHEYAHVKQYATNQLKDYERTDETRWGKTIYKSGMTYKGDAYFMAPWEIEAYGYETCLFRSYKYFKTTQKRLTK